MNQILKRVARYTRRLFLLAAASAPLLASAAFEFYDPLKPKTGPPKTVTLASSVNVVIGLINRVIPFLIGVAFVLVLAGILKYVAAGGDNEKIAEGRRVIIWGVLILFVMLSFWGLVTVVCTSLFGQCPPESPFK
ncbi:MAG: hypothetical protein HYS57_01310 [Parcubacteria group bacterium]|nr:hypothetical protein [Parcubacteria group bacterium]